MPGDNAMTADLDRYDIDGSYIGPCPICEGDMFDDGEHRRIAGELVHRACYDEIADEMDWADWEPDYEQRGNE